MRFQLGRALELASSDLVRAAELLRSALTLDPSRLSAARALAGLRLRTPDVALARTLIALVEPTDAVHEPASLAPRPLRDPALEEVRALWRMLWEQALPLFREAPPTVLQPNDRVTRVATTAESRAFADALAALGRDELPAFYYPRFGEPRLHIVRTSPPSIVAGPGFASDEGSMRFQLGRALELAEPEHILVATLPSARARVVVAAVAAAFGPADGSSVPREAAVLASELWRTMPPRGQAAVRELLASAGARWNDYDGARYAALTAGLRAGLLASGDLGAAVREACASDPELSGAPLDEEGLRAALGRSPALADLVRFAFAEPG